MILHAGTPKTGTTALQSFLHGHHDTLLERGILYPRIGVTPPPEPKHQWMVGTVIDEDAHRFGAYMRAALRETREDTHTIILSAEGLFHRWWDFTESGRAILRGLGDQFDVSVWVFFREPVSFLRSFYVQMLKNPRNCGPFYGRDVAVGQMLSHPRFAIHFDYARYIEEVDALLGDGTVRPFRYRGDTVADVLAALGLEPFDDGGERANVTLGSVGVQLLRRVNRYDLPDEARTEALQLIARLDGLIDGAKEPWGVDPDAARQVRALAAPSLRFLAQRYGLYFENDGAVAGAAD
ncbi:hypothetical protein Acid7E03_11040 [Acidisoma sp. 7E03]